MTDKCKNECMNSSSFNFLAEELKNFEAIARYINPSPGELPKISGIEIYGEVIPLNGVVGGDHLIYLDFNKRYDLDRRIKEAQALNPGIVEKLHLNKRRSGVLVADAAGHKVTDALLTAMLHQAFLTGIHYELRNHGEVTAELFEIINTRFFKSSSITKFITLIYGEIWDNGNFRFVNAGHPPPMVFSNKYEKLIDVCPRNIIHFPPIGTLPSGDDIDQRLHFSRLGYKKKYSISEINLMGHGDILFLYTDGLTDHCDEADNAYFPHRVEKVLKGIKNQSAREIFLSLKDDMLSYAPPSDDITFVVIKKV